MTLANFQGVTLVGLQPPRPPQIKISDSLDRFRTVAFGIELMRQTIHMDRISQGIDVTQWFLGVVPECYRGQVTAIVASVLEMHRGERLTDARVEAYIDDLNRQLGDRLIPVDP